MAETNMLLKKAVRNTYKKLNIIQNAPTNKAFSTTKTSKKVDKITIFSDKLSKDSKDSSKTSKSKTFKANNKKNTTSNTVSEIQTGDSNQDNDCDVMGWNNLPDMVMPLDNSDTSDTDGIV